MFNKLCCHAFLPEKEKIAIHLLNNDTEIEELLGLYYTSIEEVAEIISSIVESARNISFTISLLKDKLKDEKTLELRAEKKRKMNLPESALTDQYKSFIVSLNSVTERGLVDEFVDVMPAGDMHYLSKLYTKARPDINLSQVCDCTVCGAENQVDIPFTANFFWPE